MYELDSAFALETLNEKRILPLWHGIMHEDLKNYSPGPSDRLALDSSQQTPTEIANELLILLGGRIRKVPSNAGLFTMEEPDGTIQEGPADEISGKYIAADARLRHTGLRRSSIMGSSDHPSFTLRRRRFNPVSGTIKPCQ